jgi:hypothetical protein
MFDFFKSYTIVACGNYVTKKKRVRKYTAQRLPSTNPGVHVLLNYLTQFRPPIIHISLIAYWIITRSKTCKSFAPTQQQSRCYSIRPLPRPFTQMSTKGNFLITSQTIHIPKAQACFRSNVHKNTSFHVLYTLSLSSPFAVAWLIARRSGKF